MQTRASWGCVVLVAALAWMGLSCADRPAESEPAPEPARVGARGVSEKGAVNTTYIKSAIHGELEGVEGALDDGAEVDAVTYEGSTALMMASFHGHTEVVRTILDHGASIDKQDPNGRTALIYASSGPHAETVSLLIEKGADVNHAGHAEGWSALMYAGYSGHTEVIRILLDSGADADMEDNDGETALTFAQRNDHAEAAELLRAAMDEVEP
jgi:predicted LPLAT superfamily acyltransferase